MGLSKPTDRPSEAVQPGAEQPHLEPSALETPGPSPADRAATARAEQAIAELRRAVERVASCLETVRAANRGLDAEVVAPRRQLDGRATPSTDAEQEIAALRRALNESRQAALLERERAANEREQIFERQDEFLAALLEEREPTVESGPTAEQVTAASARRNGDTDELNQLRQMLEETQRKVSRLEAERERSREVLRRLQQQRDEAQQTVTRLTQESRKQTRPPRSVDASSSAQHGARAARAKRPPGPSSQGQSQAEPDRNPDGASSAGRAEPQSPLAAALASSDPSRRKHWRHKR